MHFQSIMGLKSGLGSWKPGTTEELSHTNVTDTETLRSIEHGDTASGIWSRMLQESISFYRQVLSMATIAYILPRAERGGEKKAPTSQHLN